MKWDTSRTSDLGEINYIPAHYSHAAVIDGETVNGIMLATVPLLRGID